MSNDKKLEEKNVYELLNANGQMDKIIDLFSEATDDEVLPEHRQLIKDNVKTIASKLDQMIVILREVNNDPEKKNAFIKELEKRKHNIANIKDADE